MAEPLLIDIFGTGATQTATTFTIAKADLASVGLTPSATNTGESLVVAILLKAMQYLNDTNQATNPDIQITIAQSFETLVNRNNATYRQKAYTIDFQKIDTSSTLDPDDY